MRYEKYTLKQEFTVEGIMTFFYYESRRDFYAKMERHDFWELVYVDKGEFEVFTDGGHFTLKQGECVFYKPNERHWGRTYRDAAPHLIVLSFVCTSEHMSFFEKKWFRFQERERTIMQELLLAGNAAFSPPVDSPSMRRPLRNDLAPVGSEQLIKNYLEILLVTLLQRRDAPIHISDLPTANKEKADQALVDEAIRYMRKNVAASLSLEDISKAIPISKAQLKSLFKERSGLTTMQYFYKLKMEEAKRLIREGNDTITEVSEKAGFSSIHYFSSYFKKVTDMTPSEYAKSVKSRLPKRSSSP